ncbi:hypothetical protein V9T40_006708 [Parthenolecanium corni]|uniref:Prefoldin subunit 2 n=1 Tax=Parthenolecanium corni TaxID=536013 RepID=A0AAN9Y8Y9_9HEMI
MSTSTKTKTTSAQEQIIGKFQTLREEQRQIAAKLAESDIEENELKIVIDALKKVDGGRKCYRLIGGVLCEKTVKDVLPVLLEKKEDLVKTQTKNKDELVKKGVELNEFKEKHNIRVHNQEDSLPPPPTAEPSGLPSSTGVLN